MSCLIGTVLEVQTWNTTHVSGGRVRSDYYGNIHSSPVRSRNVKHNQLFIRTREGTELDLEVTDLGVGLRAGHEITLVMSKSSEREEYVGILNHNTLGSEVWPGGVSALTLPRHARFLVTWTVLGILFGWLASQLNVGIGLLLVASGVYSMTRLFATKARMNSLKKEVGRILQNLTSYLQAEARAGAQAQVQTPPQVQMQLQG